MRIGLTGGIASGKSFVLRTFAELGAVTFSADEAARAILAPQGSVLKAIAQTFGASVLYPDGSLNRNLLAQSIFKDATLREKLNSLTHPPLLRLLAAQIESVYYELAPQVPVIVEIPLLYEVGLESWFDQVVVVYATPAEQVERLCKRNKLSRREAEARLLAQMPLEEKRARADIVLENHSDEISLTRATQRLWRQFSSTRERR